MFPRYSPLEPWEWRAIFDRHRQGAIATDLAALLPGLLRAQALARCGELARRTRLLAPAAPPLISLDGTETRPHTAARLEHRLYTLFAE